MNAKIIKLLFDAKEHIVILCKIIKELINGNIYIELVEKYVTLRKYTKRLLVSIETENRHYSIL